MDVWNSKITQTTRIDSSELCGFYNSLIEHFDTHLLSGALSKDPNILL